MSSASRPSELNDVFIHPEGSDQVAYYQGDPIARQEGPNREKFYADLHVWIRKHQYRGPFWRVDAGGNITADQEIAERAAKAFSNES